MDDVARRLDLAARVGRELVALGLQRHAGLARAYYREVRAGREPRSWSHEMVEEWARDLRLPPHESDVPVRPRMSSCGCEAPTTFTVRVWPRGSRHRCGRCGAEWIEA